MRISKLLLISLLGACGGGASDPCATSNCNPQTRTLVKWTFDHYPDRNFPMDSCVDFGVTKVAVDIVDSLGNVQSAQDDCGTAQVTFWGLTPGDYTVYVTPLDGNGNGLVSAPAAGTVTVGQVGDNHETSVNVTWDQWVGSFTGTFLFRISWGGMSCDALPDVKSQNVTLTVNGVVQNITTDDGQMLNGTDKKPCKKLTDEFPQSALGASFGMATLLIEGYDATDNMKYSKQFDTFVGAGITNPTLTFDVPLQ